jgi:hypothetical protein
MRNLESRNITILPAFDEKHPPGKEGMTPRAFP